MLFCQCRLFLSLILHNLILNLIILLRCQNLCLLTSLLLQSIQRTLQILLIQRIPQIFQTGSVNFSSIFFKYNSLTLKCVCNLLLRFLYSHLRNIQTIDGYFTPKSRTVHHMYIRKQSNSKNQHCYNTYSKNNLLCFSADRLFFLHLFVPLFLCFFVSLLITSFLFLYLSQYK